MSRLWDKGEPLSAAVARLTVGRDPELDLLLVPHDALASAAHATMLAEIGVLSAEEAEALCRELAAIAADDDFTIASEEEDGHTAIENRLTARLGDAGKRIHTGRSRNDQVIAALRLWGREALLELDKALLEAVGALAGLAQEHAETSMPGYTHTRQAMPTTLGHYFDSWVDALLDHQPWIETAWGHLNRSPLGSASGYGVALPLDRERVAELLGFDRVQVNTVAVQSDRGRTEALVLGVAAAIATDLGRLARDLIAWSGEEHAFLRLGAATTTGSSIMPQKRNPDPLEIARAAAARLRSLVGEIGDIYGGVGAGYHRDLQLTKAPFLEGMTLARDLLVTFVPVLEGLEVDRERCRSAIEPASAATDAVYQRVAKGEPFRDAYREVAKAPETAYDGDVAESWRVRGHAGSPARAGGQRKLERAAIADWLSDRYRQVADAWAPFDP